MMTLLRFLDESGRGKFDSGFGEKAVYRLHRGDQGHTLQFCLWHVEGERGPGGRRGGVVGVLQLDPHPG